MRGEMKKPPVEVAIAIIWKEGRYLITRRKSDVHLADLWEFPGGKRMAGETLEACLLREVEEELGVQVKIEKLFCRLEHDYADGTVILQGYLCRLVTGNPKPLASQELRWVLPSALLSYPFPEANVSLINRLAQRESDGPAFRSGAD